MIIFCSNYHGVCHISANRSDRLNISFKFATCLTRVAARRAGHRPNPTVPTLSLQKAKHVPETWFGAKYFVSVYWSNRFIEIFVSTNALGSQSFSRPFFDNDLQYDIKNVIWSGSSLWYAPYFWTGEIIIAPSGITFSGANVTGSGYTLFEIRVWYGQARRKLTLDRRTGKITEIKGQ